jgi:NADH-quinone oxidoreductase subunit A
MALMDNYLPLLVFFAFGILVPVGTIIFIRLIAPRGEYPRKHIPYECGWLPIGTAKIRFNVEYYTYAIVFLIFDVEALFLYPWAVSYKNPLITVPNFTLIACIEMFLFIVILLIGYVYAWKKGALEWIR